MKFCFYDILAINIDWPVIASIGALVLLLAIIYSSCILYRNYKYVKIIDTHNTIT